MKLILPLTAALCLFLSACASDAPPPKPDLPASISPGWSQKTYIASSAPAGLPEGTTPQCWKADYTGAASAVAEVQVCGYPKESGAFDAMQRARAEANMVKFYRGRYLVEVKWNAASRTDMQALMRGLESSLK